MGRRREFPGIGHFSITSKAAKCCIPDCNYLYEPKSGSQLHSKPLLDHLKRKHPEQYKEAIDEDEKRQNSLKRKNELISTYFPTASDSSSKRLKQEVFEIQMNKEMVHQCAVEAVTVNGLPLSVFENSGISKLMSPILSKLGISLNQRATRLLVLEAYDKKIQELKNEFLDRMVCVKTDLCSRRGRHFLGVNFQTVINGNLRVVTAAVKEMTERATGAEIRDTLVTCLKKLGIREQQIYTLTTDNGANVVKAGKLMVEDAQTEDDASDTETDPPPSCRLSEELNSVTVPAAQSVTPIRCAVHTLQLCVHDVITKKENIKKLLTNVRKVVNKTHTQNIRLMFRHGGVALPKLDCETRWGSTYDMLQSVVDSKSFLLQIALANESLLLGDEEWAAINNLLFSLKPLHNTTIALQLRNLTAGEFLCEWLKCKVQLSKAGGGTISDAFLQAVENREANLLCNSAFLSAVYMDPRFQCLLKEPQKVIAKRHLTTLWKRVMEVKMDNREMNQENVLESSVEDPESESDENIIDNLLRQGDNSAQAKAVTNMQEGSLVVESFDNTPRVGRNENIFHWWHCHPHYELKKVAEVAVGLPVTQASVERTFSGLRFILNERRLSLKADIVDAIMLLRCNT